MNKIPQGYKISTINAGFRKPEREDLALIVSDFPAFVAGLFTTNIFKAAPVLIGQDILKQGKGVRAIVVNSGQANACTGAKGYENCLNTVNMLAKYIAVLPDQILPMSTGVIGEHLKMDLWNKALPKLSNALGTKNCEDFARAIMTTDAFPKFCTAEIHLKGGVVKIAAMAKGAGMICPNMATMLAVVLCDAKISENLWQKIFADAVGNTFNRVSVDGDTSTNDTIYGLVNSASNVCVEEYELDYFAEQLEQILSKVSYMLVKDGEGATKVIHISVDGAKSDSDAEKIARTVGHSQLVKTAMFGQDANWGRIVAAAGRSQVDFDAAKLALSISDIEIFRSGQACDNYEEDKLNDLLKQPDVYINLHLASGTGSYTLLASDLSHTYVDCNAAYRT